MNRIWSVPVLAIGISTLGAQSTDTTTKLRLTAFVDTYYAYDVNRPADGERRFTTQPVRHDELNVNLAWLGVILVQAWRDVRRMERRARMLWAVSSTRKRASTSGKQRRD